MPDVTATVKKKAQLCKTSTLPASCNRAYQGRGMNQRSFMWYNTIPVCGTVSIVIPNAK